jgi:hypothetical protein
MRVKFGLGPEGMITHCVREKGSENIWTYRRASKEVGGGNYMVKGFQGHQIKEDKISERCSAHKKEKCI